MKSTINFMTIILVLGLMGSPLCASEVLVYRNESMPWCGTVAGKDAGITIDILNAVTNNGGPIFKFKYAPWHRAQILVQQNKGTCIIPFTRTATREKHHEWIIELVPNQVRLTTARNPIIKVSIPPLLTIDNAKPLTIGIIRGSALIPYMKASGFVKLYEVGTAELLAKMLKAGHIHAMAESKGVDNYAWNQIGQKDDELIVGPNVGEIKYIYLAAALNFPPEITEDIRNAMSKVRESGALEAILNKWMR